MKLFLSISFGIFLFVLFFEPFSLARFDFNNKLVFVAGLATIIFLFMMIIRPFFYWLVRNERQKHEELIIPAFLEGFIMLILSSVAFAFYIRYVGSVSITFHIMFKVIIICLVPPVVLRLYDIFNEFTLQNKLLIKEKIVIQKQLEKYEEDYLNKSVDFISENSTDHLHLTVADVAFVKSADNYVEIIYRDGDGFNRKLLRNTLKNIEQQIKPYSNFIRCHRICIVNIHYIEKLHCDHTSHWLTIRGIQEKIPVSRQYLLKLKEIL